eukprot:4968050-Pleurochrysis_carterae.AAC.2
MGRGGCNYAKTGENAPAAPAACSQGLVVNKTYEGSAISHFLSGNCTTAHIKHCHLLSPVYSSVHDGLRHIVSRLPLFRSRQSASRFSILPPDAAHD